MSGEGLGECGFIVPYFSKYSNRASPLSSCVLCVRVFHERVCSHVLGLVWFRLDLLGLDLLGSVQFRLVQIGSVQIRLVGRCNLAVGVL